MPPVRLQPGEIARQKNEDGFFVIVGPSGADDVFIVPLIKQSNGEYVRLDPGQGRYARIADLEKDLTSAVVKARSEDGWLASCLMSYWNTGRICQDLSRHPRS
jgi:hypothetical protein